MPEPCTDRWNSPTRWYYRRLADVFERRVDEMPARVVDGRPLAGGRGLLKRYVRAIEQFGCTAEAADTFEANAATWTEGSGA